MGRPETLLEIDRRPEAMRKLFGYRDEHLLVLTEPVIPHGGERVGSLHSRFVDGLRHHGKDLAEMPHDEARAVIGTAAASAMSADQDLAAEKDGCMTFVLVCVREGGCRVCLLGAFYVVHFQGRGAKEVLMPHSVYREAMARGVPQHVARDHAGAPTHAASPGQRCDADIRIAEVELGSRGTLLALPEPRGLVDSEGRVEAPASVDEIHEMAERLRAEGGYLRGDRPMWSRSLLSVSQLEDDGSHDG